MDRARVLDQLAAALQGRPPCEAQWPAVLDLANQALVTPALARAAGGAAPARLRPFLDEVLRRNRERNRRLWRQLEEAVGALNGGGIEPVLLKGAALWAMQPPGEPFDRILTDLDLMVNPSEVDAALRALGRAGFQLAARYPGPAVHVVAELGRPQDPGLIDLHQRPPGPPGLAETPALATRRRPVSIGRGRALAPDPASQIHHLVLHDQFHDGGYWRGGFDLRHLSDVAWLARRLTEADRAWLHEAAGGALARRALAAELLAARRLFGGPDRARSRAAEATWRRWRRQYAHPGLRGPLAVAAAVLEAPDVAAHRRLDLRGRQRVLGEIGAAPAPPSLPRLQRILTVGVGKI